jgi:hypothetical protein
MTSAQLLSLSSLYTESWNQLSSLNSNANFSSFGSTLERSLSLCKFVGFIAKKAS